MKDYTVTVETSTKICVSADNEERAEEMALQEFWENVGTCEPYVTEISED